MSYQKKKKIIESFFVARDGLFVLENKIQKEHNLAKLIMWFEKDTGGLFPLE